LSREEYWLRRREVRCGAMIILRDAKVTTGELACCGDGD
jgi:hypothetical protein